MQSCTLRDHGGEATCIGKHFLILTSDKVVGDEALLLGARLLVPLISVVITRCNLILSLALDIYW